MISIAKRAEEQDPNDSVISSPGRQHMSGARTQHACTRAHNSVDHRCKPDRAKTRRRIKRDA